MSDRSELAENYRRAYDNRVGFGQGPVLILIDFCQAYFDPDCELHAEVEEPLANALALCGAVKSAQLPVILTNVVLQRGGVDGGRFFEKVWPPRHFLAGSALGAFAKGLSPFKDEIVISKQYPSAFFGTSLASTLTAMQVDSVLLKGLTSSGCVRATCVDAMSHESGPRWSQKLVATGI